MSRDIINTAYYSPKYERNGKNLEILQRDALIYTVRDSETGKTDLVVKPVPDYTFYRTKEFNHRYPKICISKDEVQEIRCPYYLRRSEMAKAIGRGHEYQQAKSKSWFDGQDWFDKNIVASPFLYSVDFDIEDQFKLFWSFENPRGKVVKLKKAFADIEVDIWQFNGKLDVETAERPINCITYFDETSMSLHAFLLDNQPQNAKLQMVKKDPYGYYDKILKKKLPDLGYKIFINFYENESRLLIDFFKQIHEDKPDFCGFWYMPFDMRYILNRIKRHLKRNPYQICCHPSIPDEFKRIDYYIDPGRDKAKIALNKNKGLKPESELVDWVNISGYTQFYDMRCMYSNLRKRFKEDDYSLDTICNKNIGEGKTPLSEYGLTIRTAAYENYELFLEYSLTDTLRLYQLEKKLHDLDSWYTTAGVTRLSKTHNVSFIIRNRLTQTVFEPHNQVSGNNVKYEIWGQISGAIVARQELCYADSVEINGKPSTIYEHCIDMDASSQYPSLTEILNICKATVYYKGLRIYTLNDKGEEVLLGSGDDFHQLLQTRASSIFDLCQKYFNLPSVKEMSNLFKLEVKNNGSNKNGKFFEK